MLPARRALSAEPLPPHQLARCSTELAAVGATMSSTRREDGFEHRGENVAGLLIDGITSSLSQSTTHDTLTTSNYGRSTIVAQSALDNTWAASRVSPWLEIDLGSSHRVGEVEIYNRDDCCMDRLGFFEVTLSNSPYSSERVTCATHTAGSLDPGPISVPCDGEGQYVRVTLPGTGRMINLREVNVYPQCVPVPLLSDVPPPTPPAPTPSPLAGRYCASGHTGPLCEQCIEEGEYFSLAHRRCVACPAATRFGILVAAVVGGATLLAAIRAATQYIPACGRLARRLYSIESRVGIQPKFKVILSFIQVSTSLNVVYGVRFDKDFMGWLRVLTYANVDVLELAYPGACIGSMSDRLLIGALWPIAVVLAVSIVIAAYALAVRAVAAGTSLQEPTETNAGDTGVGRAGWLQDGQSVAQTVLDRCLYAMVFVFYVVLPSVSRSIFKAKQCLSFGFDDAKDLRISYLLADLSLKCNDGPTWEDETRFLDAYFWARAYATGPQYGYISYSQQTCGCIELANLSP